MNDVGNRVLVNVSAIEQTRTDGAGGLDVDPDNGIRQGSLMLDKSGWPKRFERGLLNR